MTIIPTMHLRLMRDRTYPTDDRCQIVYKLQQRFDTSEGPEWLDVPVVDEHGKPDTFRTGTLYGE